MFGLYDTQDRVWMGDNTGPHTYVDYWVARIASQMVDVRLRQEPGRTQAKEYDPSPKRLRDSIDTDISALDALRSMETGKII